MKKLWLDPSASTIYIHITPSRTCIIVDMFIVNRVITLYLHLDIIKLKVLVHRFNSVMNQNYRRVDKTYYY